VHRPALALPTSGAEFELALFSPESEFMQLKFHIYG
jgi:hypothetical protein